MWLAMWLDDCKLPRAWAKSSNKDLAKKEAQHQLETYIEKKRALGELISQRDFTLKVRREDPEQDKI